MTDAVIENQLLGKETIGVYPLLPDETCWFLATDFDEKTGELNGQLSRRSIDVHLARYRAENSEDRQTFINVVSIFRKGTSL